MVWRGTRCPFAVLLLLGLVAATSMTEATAASGPAAARRLQAGSLRASVSALDFGPVVLGAQLSKGLQITNIGVVPLTFTAQLSGPFHLAADLHQTLDPGAVLTLIVVFQPLSLGPAAGLLRIIGTPQVSPANDLVTDIPLSGVGIAPQAALRVSPPVLDFQAVELGTAGRLPIVLSHTGNPGDPPVTVTAITFSPGPFALAAHFAGPLAAGESRSLVVVFRPSDPGPATATLRIASNDPVAPLLTVGLSGIGVAAPVLLPRLTVSPEAVDLGDIPLGQSAGATLTLRNEGTAPLAVSGLAASGAGWSAASPPTPLSLAPGATLAVPLRFQALSPGAASGTLQILSNDPTRPALAVPLRARVPSPPAAGFSVDVSPPSVHVTPGRPATVVYTLRAVGGQAVPVRCGDATVELPTGRRLTLATRPCQLDLPASGAPVLFEDAALLPEGVLTPGVREVAFVRSFVAAGTAPRPGEAHQAMVRLLPTGSLGADFAITSVSVDFPVDGTAVAERGLLRARALVSGEGTGSAQGVWRVDGVPFESFSVDLVGGRPAVLTTAFPLPTVIAGLHELDLEIHQPAPLRTAAVRYLVTQGDLERLRWTLPPGFRVYLQGGSPPEWSWTPKPGARGYEIRLDGATAPGELQRTPLPSWQLPRELLGRLAPGEHRIEVRALYGSAEAPGAVLDGDRLSGTFAILAAPARPALALAGDAGDRRLRWEGPPGDGIFVLVAVAAEGGAPRLRRLTAGREIALAALSELVPGGERLLWHVEAYNDHGEKVGESAPLALAPGGPP